MLFISLSMLSRVATKMELMELETADTLQHCTFLHEFFSVLFAITRSVVIYAVALFVLIGVAMLLVIVQPY